MFTIVQVIACLDGEGAAVPWVVQLQFGPGRQVLEMSGGSEQRYYKTAMSESGIARALLGLRNMGPGKWSFVRNDYGVSRGRGVLAFDADANGGFLVGSSAYEGAVRDFIAREAPLEPEDGGFAYCVAIGGLPELGLILEVLEAGGLFPVPKMGATRDGSPAAEDFLSAAISGVTLFATRTGSMWEQLQEVVLGQDMNAVAARQGAVQFTLFPQDPARRDTGFRFWRRFEGAVNAAISVAMDRVCLSGVAMSQRDQPLNGVAACVQVDRPASFFDLIGEGSARRAGQEDQALPAHDEPPVILKEEL